MTGPMIPLEVLDALLEALGADAVYVIALKDHALGYSAASQGAARTGTRCDTELNSLELAVKAWFKQQGAISAAPSRILRPT